MEYSMFLTVRSSVPVLERTKDTTWPRVLVTSFGDGDSFSLNSLCLFLYVNGEDIAPVLWKFHQHVVKEGFKAGNSFFKHFRIVDLVFVQIKLVYVLKGVFGNFYALTVVFAVKTDWFGDKKKR